MTEHRFPPLLHFLTGAVIIVLLLISGYVAAYLAWGKLEYEYNSPIAAKPDAIARTFRQTWVARCFVPASWAESKIRDVRVLLYTMEE